MKSTFNKKATAWALAGAMSLAVAGAATTAFADTDEPANTPTATERANAYLQATQKELRSAGISVSSIDPAGTRGAVDYYALRGERDHCILSAPSDGPAGISTALSCAPNDSTRPLGLPIFGAGSRTVGYAFWTEGGTLSATASDTGAPLKTTGGPLLSFVELSSPSQGISGTWTRRGGEEVTLSVQSADETERQARALLDAKRAELDGK